MHTPHSDTSRGFTLIELLVTIAIISLLSSVVLACVNTARAKARDSRRIADMHSIVNALELYYDSNGHYPTQTTITASCNTAPNGAALDPLVTDGFTNLLPTDPTNNSATPNRLCYHYMSIGDTSSYSGSSSWYCNGRPRTDYEYFLAFSTEVSTAAYPRITNSSNTPNNEYTYCIPGPLR